MICQRLFVLATLCAVSSAAGWDCAPKDAINAYESATELILQGDRESGIAKLEQAVAIYPDFYEAFEALEWEYKNEGRYADAIDAVEQQVRLRPGMADQHDFSISMYRRLAATPQAAKEALARSAGFPVGSDEAIAACKDAIRIYPAFVEAHTDLVQHYIRNGDEVAAKDALAKTIPLDPYGAAPLLVNVMHHYQPAWLTEEYGKELGELFSRHRSASVDALEDTERYPEFSEEEISEILAAYSDQLALLRSLVDGSTEVAELSSEYRASESHKERLRVLRFAHISATRRGPSQLPFPYTFFDVTREFDENGESGYLPPCFYSKVSHDLEIPSERSADWRVGLCQLWFEKPYCRPECATLLEFRADVEVDDSPYRFAATVLVVDEVAEHRQCIDELGESSIRNW